jgi:hypothetical protein
MSFMLSVANKPIMLSVVKPGVVKPGVVKPGVVKPGVVMLNVMAPVRTVPNCKIYVKPISLVMDNSCSAVGR